MNNLNDLQMNKLFLSQKRNNEKEMKSNLENLTQQYKNFILENSNIPNTELLRKIASISKANTLYLSDNDIIDPIKSCFHDASKLVAKQIISKTLPLLLDFENTGNIFSYLPRDITLYILQINNHLLTVSFDDFHNQLKTLNMTPQIEKYTKTIEEYLKK